MFGLFRRKIKKRQQKSFDEALKSEIQEDFCKPPGVVTIEITNENPEEIKNVPIGGIYK